MPIGGPGHCGGCLYNLVDLSNVIFGRSKDEEKFTKVGFCILRRVYIPVSGYTYCENVQYDDFGGQTRLEQTRKVVEGEPIKGSIYIGSDKWEDEWNRSPNDGSVWDFEEWKRWNEFILKVYPELKEITAFDNLDTSDWWW